MISIITQLSDIGIPEREARVYTALLELGESTVLPIARKADVQRTYVYDILELLKKRGLVSHIEKNGRRHYIAEDPSKIGQILKERVHNFSGMLPELKALYNSSPTKPRVQFYEGKEEIKALYEHLKDVAWYDSIFSQIEVLKVWGNYSNELGKKVADNGVEVRELVTSSDNPEYAKYYKKGKQELRHLPDWVEFNQDFILFENKLALISYEKDLHTIVIESPGIVQSFRSLFDFMWEKSAPDMKKCRP
jgi:sugar-specific transcriptional regulator TrmB